MINLRAVGCYFSSFASIRKAGTMPGAQSRENVLGKLTDEARKAKEKTNEKAQEKANENAKEKATYQAT